MSGTLREMKINAEFSLQSASHNSRENHQGQSWSQIRELYESFITSCYSTYYTYSCAFSSCFYHFLATKALR